MNILFTSTFGPQVINNFKANFQFDSNFMKPTPLWGLTLCGHSRKVLKASIRHSIRLFLFLDPLIVFLNPLPIFKVEGCQPQVEGCQP